MATEAFARVKSDALLAAQGWEVLDCNDVRLEVQLTDGTRADHVLCNLHGLSITPLMAS